MLTYFVYDNIYFRSIHGDSYVFLRIFAFSFSFVLVFVIAHQRVWVSFYVWRGSELEWISYYYILTYVSIFNEWQINGCRACVCMCVRSSFANVSKKNYCSLSTSTLTTTIRIYFDNFDRRKFVFAFRSRFSRKYRWNAASHITHKESWIASLRSVVCHHFKIARKER